MQLKWNYVGAKRLFDVHNEKNKFLFYIFL